LFEMMMQIPMIFRHPGKIPAGGKSDLLVSNYDFLPTVLGHVGLAQEMPTQPRSPGRDFSSALLGRRIPWENVLYYEMELTRGVRDDRWKYVSRYPDGIGELYDLENDPRERVNLFGQPHLAAVQAHMANRLEDFFNQY